MKIVKVEKEYSWLELQMTLKDYHKMAHVTLKFFGDASIDPLTVKHGVEVHEHKIEFAELEDFEFEPVTFTNGLTTYWVLKLTQYPYWMDDIKREFNLIKDQFNPWNAHITVTQEYWQNIVDKNLKFKDVVTAIINETSLYLGSPT